MSNYTYKINYKNLKEEEMIKTVTIRIKEEKEKIKITLGDKSPKDVQTLLNCMDGLANIIANSYQKPLAMTPRIIFEYLANRYPKTKIGEVEGSKKIKIKAVKEVKDYTNLKEEK
jgi:hypothetical protein